MLWVKAFHVIFMVTWFAGLFYLPRLFVYHAQAFDPISLDRFKLMERKLYYGIMTPGAVLTIGLGIWLLSANCRGYLATGWMPLKLGCVLALVVYHAWCGVLLSAFAGDRNVHSHRWYRWFNEFPVLILIAIVVLIIVRPV